MHSKNVLRIFNKNNDLAIIIRLLNLNVWWLLIGESDEEC